MLRVYSAVSAAYIHTCQDSVEANAQSDKVNPGLVVELAGFLIAAVYSSNPSNSLLLI